MQGLALNILCICYVCHQIQASDEFRHNEYQQEPLFFFPRIRVGDDVCFFGLPGVVLMGSFPANNKASVTPFINCSRLCWFFFGTCNFSLYNHPLTLQTVDITNGDEMGDNLYFSTIFYLLVYPQVIKKQVCHSDPCHPWFHDIRWPCQDTPNYNGLSFWNNISSFC